MTDSRPYTAEELEQYDGHFNDAEASDTNFRDVPVGTYQTYVEKAFIDPPNQHNDHPRLKLWCKILNGEYGGAMLFPDGNFDPEYIHHLKGMTIKMGFEFTSAGEIADSLNDMLDRVLEVAVVKRKKDPTKKNHYVNRFVRMLKDAGEEPPAHGDDELPF